MDDDFKLGHRKRVRERFLASNDKSVPDYEILEIILFSAKPRGDVKPIAKALLKKFKNMAKLVNASPEELSEIDGVNLSVITSLKALKVSIDRVLFAESCKGDIIKNWKELIQYLKSNIGNNSIENFKTIYLNKGNEIIGEDDNLGGTVDQVNPYIREIIKKTINIGASALIIAHNHPSGDPKPSKPDINFTKELLQSCECVNIRLLDHIIITNNGYFSFKNNGLL